MPNVHAGSRLMNLFKGFLSLFIRNIETANPEIVYDNAIQSLKEKYPKMKQAAGRVIAERNQLSNALEKAKARLAQIETDLAAALKTNQDDLALQLITAKNEAAAEVTGLQTELTAANGESEKIKAALLDLENETKSLAQRKNRQLAKLSRAEARIQIDEMVGGMSVRPELEALDNVDKAIEARVGEADLGQELRDSSLDERMKNLRKQGASLNAQEELQRLKASMGAAQGAATPKQL